MENNNLEDYYKQKNIEDNSFEENIKELEDIVNRLESGDIPLDDAIKEFNKAMTLVKSCDEKLKEAKDSISSNSSDPIAGHPKIIVSQPNTSLTLTSPTLLQSAFTSPEIWFAILSVLPVPDQ